MIRKRLKDFAENDIDRVVHFAAESHVDRSIRNPGNFVQTNVLGTAVMLNCAKAAWENPDGSFKEGKKFLHVSTDEVYGSLENEGEYFYETTPYAPHSPIPQVRPARTCWLNPIWIPIISGEHYQLFQQLRPLSVSGEAIPLIINNALHGKKLPVYGDGKNVRDWLYVEDRAKAIDMVQENGRLLKHTISVDIMKSRIYRSLRLS